MSGDERDAMGVLSLGTKRVSKTVVFYVLFIPFFRILSTTRLLLGSTRVLCWVSRAYDNTEDIHTF